MNTKALALLCTPALIAFVGCSSDVTFSSGVDGATKISEVTPDQAQSICDASAAAGKEFAEANKDGLCALAASFAGAFGAVGGGDPAALCQTALDECKAQPLETTGVSTCNVAVAATGCEATVAEMEDCYNESLSALADIYGELGGKSCTDLTTASTDNTPVVAATPSAACAALAKCPGLNVGIPGTGTSTAS